MTRLYIDYLRLALLDYEITVATLILELKRGYLVPGLEPPANRGDLFS